MKKKFALLLLATTFCVLSFAGCNQTMSPNGTTPNQTNSGAGQSETDTFLPTPTPEGTHVAFSADSGFYDTGFELTLSCNEADAKIYYTTDGSIPDENATLYTKSIKISKNRSKNVLSAQTGVSYGNSYLPQHSVDKATVLRAVAVLPDGTKTPVASATYFVGLNRAEKYGDVPVISIQTDFENLYDYETGIYILGKCHDDWLAADPNNAFLESWQMQGNFTQSGREWERPVSVEYLTSDGSAGFLIDMGMRIMGGASRNHPQKSLKLIAREEYGAKALNYELIPGNLRSDGTELLTKYKSFVLRIGGNDADFGRMRDPLLSQLAENCRFETQQATPCVVYLNGEYWGMYSITEDYSDNYFENNYGIDNKNIVLVKCGEIEDGEAEDIELFRQLYLCITRQDMSNDRYYKEACELLDMGSFIDYCAYELYIGNQDSMFENNNWRMWRVREADGATKWSDGKWRMVAYDSDFSTGIYDGGKSYGDDNITGRLFAKSEEETADNLEHYAPIELLRSLIKNEQFKEEFILALCDMRNIHFESSRVTTALNAMSPDYIKLLPESYARFGPDWVAYQDGTNYIAGRIKELRVYLNGRYLNFPNLIKKVFGLGNLYQLTLSVSDTSLGTVQVNHGIPDFTSAYSGKYFPETTVTLTALPAEGCRFVGWETESSLVTDKSAATISVPMTEAVKITAIFEKDS